MKHEKAADINGVLLVDKPAGVTSAAVVARVKRYLNLSKTGHAGTLDPFATGLLVIGLNRATRLMRFLMESDKRYGAELTLGVETDTQDHTGRVTATAETAQLRPETMAAVFEQFVGTLRQTPPVYSALKHRGVPLYRLAREGKPVQKAARTVSVKALRIVAIDLPRVRFEVECGSGTYIRTLGADIGRAMGCGGHLSALRRLAAGGFKVEEALPLDIFDHPGEKQRVLARIIAPAKALKNMPAFTADDTLAQKLKFGQAVQIEDLDVDIHKNGPAPPESGRVKVVTPDRHLLAVLEYNVKKQCFDYCCSFAD